MIFALVSAIETAITGADFVKVEALGKVMDELKIPYKIEGPYKKNLAKHKL